jgi:glutamyl endopeptidase
MQRDLEYELEDELERELEEEYEGELEAEWAGELEAEWEEEFETAPGALYEVIGRDSRVRVTNTTAAPFRYICNLEYDGSAMCTGTLIGPRTVLTAGHCINGRHPSRMRVIPGRNGTLEPLPATQAAAFRVAPGYRPASSTDYGIIHLRDAIGSQVGYWSRTHSRARGDPVGTSISATPLPLRAGTLTVNISGYPADMPNNPRFGCRDPRQPRQRCRHSLLGDPRRQRICGTYQYRSYDRTARLSGGMLHYLNDTCPGHSGSPVWVRRHPSMGGRVLIGIHVAGDDPATRGVANRSVRINDTVRRFIIANTI